MFNSINLIYNAKYSERISRDVEWVPMAILGQTAKSKSQMKTIRTLPVEERKLYISNLYEAVQLFHISKFAIFDNKHIIETENSVWEISKGGCEVVYDNCGMCAECAAWLVYFLQGIYEEIGFLTLIGTKLGGHIINYIKDNGYFYFVDMSMQVYEIAVNNAIENGDIKEFRKNPHLTCSVLRTRSIEMFYSFYCSFYRLKMKEFLSFYYTGECAIPIGYQKKDQIILLPAEYDMKMLECSLKKGNIKWKRTIIPDGLKEYL